MGEFYGFDTFPEFKMDPDLAAVLSLITMMGETPLIEQLTPERLEALERFQGKLTQARAQNDGSSLLTSTFHRLAQLGVQARRSFGPMSSPLRAHGRHDLWAGGRFLI